MSGRFSRSRKLALLSLLIVGVVLAEQFTMQLNGVDVHAKKFSMSALVATLKSGDTIQILEKPADGWAHIKFGDQEGYISAIKLDPPKEGFAGILKNSSFTANKEASDPSASMAARGIGPGAAVYASTKNYKPDALDAMIDMRRSVCGPKFDQFTKDGKVGRALAWNVDSLEINAQFHLPGIPKLPNVPLPIPGRSGRGPGIGANNNPQDGIDFLKNWSAVVEIDNPVRQDEIGQSIALAISNRYPLCTDAKLNEYITLVGLTVASVSPRPDLEYAFGLAETNEVGAFSTPGGYIFITRGALRLMQDESELAGVLAHEIGHVVKHHGIDAVKSARLKTAVDQTVSKYGGAYSAYSGACDFGTDFVLVKGYSQGQEREADAEAINYLVAAGYDPRGFVRFLGRMDQFTRQPGGLPQAMSTHPGTPERIANTSRQIGALPKIGGVTLKDRFDANIPKS